MKKKTLLVSFLFLLAFNSWGAKFNARIYGEQYSFNEFEYLISQDFIKRFPSDKFEIFLETNVSQVDSDMIVCSSSAGVVPLNSFEHPQRTYVVQGFKSIQNGITDYHKKNLGAECLKRALNKMMSDNMSLIYVPAKK